MFSSQAKGTAGKRLSLPQERTENGRRRRFPTAGFWKPRPKPGLGPRSGPARGAAKGGSREPRAASRARRAPTARPSPHSRRLRLPPTATHAYLLCPAEARLSRSPGARTDRSGHRPARAPVSPSRAGCGLWGHDTQPLEPLAHAGS